METAVFAQQMPLNAQHRNALWQMRPHLLLKHLHRCSRHLLVVINESGA